MISSSAAHRSGQRHALAAVRADCTPMTGSPRDYDELIRLVGDARIVLIGEASHGTHEFYRERARLTKRLITELGFDTVAVEADWPDAYRVNRYVRGQGGDRDAEEALRGFQRFPTWMWRNADVLDFVGWLRAHNDRVAPADAVGFYGLDLYSLYASADAVIRYLDDVDPAAAGRARRRYGCFEPFGGESQAYGKAVVLGVSESCRRSAVEQLVELRRRAAEYLRRDGLVAEDEQFCAEQNAQVIANAEEYYRTMFGDPAGSWNLRDRHMADTLDQLLAHLDRRDDASRVVVWEHNSHVGDARATEMAERGELNVGQLARERHGASVVNVGLTTQSGSVTAASDWGSPAELRLVRPALDGSYEDLFHTTGMASFSLCLANCPESASLLRGPLLERAIGVVYRPETERQSHYFAAVLSRQFDAVIHIDTTRGVEPLERTPEWELEEPPETYPFAV
jgi:erythromycin esterase-like protein